MRKPELRWSPAGSVEHAALLELRRDVLRRPLGLDFTAEQLARESSELHLGAWEGSVLLGALILQDLGEGAGQVRQVSVRAEARGAGIGRLMMLEAEREARSRGLSRLSLHARASVSEFYARLGYRPEGPRYGSIGIEHQDMTKDLGLRDAVAADIPEMKALIFAHGVNDWNHLPKAAVEAHLDRIASGETLGVVAEEEGALAGFCTFNPGGVIGEAVVRREAAGKGLGTRLLLAAAERLFALGLTEVLADRHEENAASAGMMRKAGFTVVKVYDDPERRPSGSRRTALCRKNSTNC